MSQLYYDLRRVCLRCLGARYQQLDFCKLSHQQIETIFLREFACSPPAAMQVLSRTAASFVMAWLASAPMDLPHHHSSCWAGEPSAEVRAFTQRIEGVEPSVEAQANLRRAFTAQREGLLAPAEVAFSDAIKEWSRSGAPADELAAIYKQRGIVRQQQGKLQDAREDLSSSLELATARGAAPDPAEIQRTFVLRARVEEGLSEWRAAERDLTAAIERLDDLDAIEATNPFLFAERGNARSRLGNYVSASEDALRAEADFKAIGDRIRRLLSASDAALALYGAGDYPGAVERMRFEFKNKGMPATNNPDDIPLLQELSRKDAELHLAYAGHLFAAEGKVQQAATQWESGCIRLEAYVQDGEERLKEEAALLQEEQRRAMSSAQSATLRASSVRGNVMNSDFVAILNGLDPQSPYVNQRPQRSYFWYKVGEGDIERRDSGNALAQIDPSLSCAKFRDKDWLVSNRPEWPPQLVENVRKYAEAVPQQPIVMPRKGGPPSRGEVEF